MLQYFPLTLQTIQSSVEKIGKVTDEVADDVAQKMLDEVLDITSSSNITLEQVEELEVAFIGVVKALQTMQVVGLAVEPIGGFGAGKIVDTNQNASDLKTFGTLILGSFASNLASMLIAPAAVQAVTTFTTRGEIKRLQNELSMIEAGYGDLLANGSITLTQHNAALTAIQGVQKQFIVLTGICSLISGAGNIAAIYHGYKRNNDSLGYALAWAFTGLNGLGLAVEQGFAKPL